MFKENNTVGSCMRIFVIPGSKYVFFEYQEKKCPRSKGLK